MKNKYLAIYNGTNKRFRRDGDEFQREALAWSLAQPEPVELVDVRDGRIRREVRKMKDLSVLAFFCHGTPKGLPRMRESYKCVKGLAETIAGVTKKITIILYSCSCGRGWWGRWGTRRWNKKNKADVVERVEFYSPRDGYAVALCCELDKIGVDAEVIAHLTAGHTTRNPHVVKAFTFDGEIRRRRNIQSWNWKKWKADMKGEKRFTFWR